MSSHYSGAAGFCRLFLPDFLAAHYGNPLRDAGPEHDGGPEDDGGPGGGGPEDDGGPDLGGLDALATIESDQLFFEDLALLWDEFALWGPRALVGAAEMCGEPRAPLRRSPLPPVRAARVGPPRRASSGRVPQVRALFAASGRAAPRRGRLPHTR